MGKILKCMAIFASLIVIFGIFFGIEYSEVRKSEYAPTICQCLSADIISRYCCDLNCNKTCTADAQLDLQKCEVLISQSQSLSPDSCSQNSTLCPKSGSDTYCENSSSGCSCQMNCTACYDVKLEVVYFVGPLHPAPPNTTYIGQQQKNSTYT